MARPIRLKTHWFKEERTQSRTPEDVASAMTPIVWRTANHRVQNLREGKFEIAPGASYVEILAELMCFEIVVADRIAFRYDPGDWRERFTASLTNRVGALLQENFDELLGPAPGGGYKKRFVDLCNRRATEYAYFDYGPDGPEFGMLRHFGESVTHAMTDPDDRRWAADQAMTVEGPECVDVIERGMRGLLGMEPKRPRSLTRGD
ncbi:MAG: hypothetical protein JSW68_00565 [Burkholderiales bacterium]|nr:MAG: hypothetical protein JSW68_00565 [Burkholderiales bacterium]